LRHDVSEIILQSCHCDLPNDIDDEMRLALDT